METHFRKWKIAVSMMEIHFRKLEDLLIKVTYIV
jgi:hypothetical protein